jgi:hypothetical protein
MSFRLSFCAICIASLAMMGGITVARAQAPAQTQAASGSTTASTPASPLARLSLDRFSATRERPLFSPTRRPAPPPPPVTVIPKQPPAPPSLTLLGVIMDAEEARAIVQIANEVRRLRMGEDVGGWKVTQIESRKLVLSLDSSRSATFTMFCDQNNALPKEPIKHREASPALSPSPPPQRRERRE